MGWLKYLTDFENQNGKYVITQGCVAYSKVHLFEIKLNYLIQNNLLSKPNLDFLKNNGYLNSDGKVDISEAYCVILSGTVNPGNIKPGQTYGNTISYVDQTVLKYGLVPESDFDYPIDLNDPKFNTEDYDKQRPSDTTIAKGKEFLKHFDIKFRPLPIPFYESVGRELLDNPVQITIGIGPGYYTDKIVKNSDAPQNHAIVVLDENPNLEIYDSLAPFIKQLVPDYKIYYAESIIINPKEVQMIDKKTLNLDGEIGVFVSTSDPSGLPDLNKLFGVFLDQNPDGSIPTDIQAHKV